MRAALSVLAIAIAVLVGGCAAPFDPAGPCDSNGSAPGAYPEIEALVPGDFRGIGPQSLDSGRNCTEESLGTLWSAGIRDMRYAGGVWKTGSESGVTLAILRAAGLTSEQVGTFYEIGARDGRKTEDVRSSRPQLEGGAAFRLDLTNGGYLQSVVVLPDDRTGDVRVVLVSSAARDVPGPTDHDAIVDEAVDAFQRASRS